MKLFDNWKLQVESGGYGFVRVQNTINIPGKCKICGEDHMNISGLCTKCMYKTATNKIISWR